MHLCIHPSKMGFLSFTIDFGYYRISPQSTWSLAKMTMLLLLLTHFSCFWLCVTLWTAAHQASLSMGFFRHEDWNGLPCPPPGDLPDPGIEPGSHWLQWDSLPSEPQGKPLEWSYHPIMLSSFAWISNGYQPRGYKMVTHSFTSAFLLLLLRLNIILYV